MRPTRRRALTRITVPSLCLAFPFWLAFFGAISHQNTLRLARAIQKADEKGATDAGEIRALLEGGADPNAPIDTPDLTLMDMVKQAFHLSKSKQDHETILFRAAGICDSRTLESLLKAGGDACAVSDSISALTYAVTNDNLTNAELLVEAGADVNCRGQSHTPLEAAAEDQSELPQLQFLLAHGADPNVRDWAGVTPLMYALGSPQKLRLLLQAGAQVDLPDFDGDTALMYAYNADASEAAEALLQAGADPSFCNHKGDSPAKLAAKPAESADPPEVADIIRRYSTHMTSSGAR